ncbi:pentatricopeptide repeat-containing protein [Tanacetum coccineum]
MLHSYPKHDPTIPWNEMQPVLGMLRLVDTKKSVTGKKAKPKKKQGPLVKKGIPVKKAILVKNSVSFSPTITKRSVNSSEGCSKHREGTSRDAEKSPRSPKWTKSKIIGDKKHGPVCGFRLWASWMTTERSFQINAKESNKDGHISGLTLISDGHKGLHDAVRDWLPNSEHRKCTRHIYANFKKKFSGIQLQKLFWHATSCTVPHLFYSKMEEMKQINSEAYDYLIGRDPNSWSRAFFNLSVKCLAFENGYVRAIIK